LRVVNQSLSIVSVGECTLDEYIEQEVTKIGGISLNFAAHAKRSGASRVSLVSRAGDEADLVRAKLHEVGVDDSHLHVCDGATARQKIILRDGERIFPVGGYSFGVMQGFELGESDAQFVRRHDVLSCALFTQTRALFEQCMFLDFAGARAADFLDLADFDFDARVVERYLPMLRVAFVSADDAMLAKLRLVRLPPQAMIVATLGARGSVALTPSGEMYQPAIAIPQVIDTTGCGDAFQGAFCAHYFARGDVRAALWNGAQSAAKVAQIIGAS
jgi:fructoselysine 6-kinase